MYVSFNDWEFDGNIDKAFEGNTANWVSRGISWPSIWCNPKRRFADHFGKRLNVLLNLFFNSTPSRIGRLRGGASCSTFIAAKEGPEAS